MQSSATLGPSSGMGHLAGTRVAVVASALICGEGGLLHNPNYLVPQPSKHDQRAGSAELEPESQTDQAIPTGSSRVGGGDKDRSTKAIKGWYIRAGPSLQGHQNALFTAG